MKLFLCEFVLMLYCGCVYTSDVDVTFEDCLKNVTKDTYNDVFNNTRPNTYAGECLLECMLNTSNLLIPQSGLVDTRKLVSYLRDIYPSDHDKETELHLLTKAIYKCKTHGAVSGDKCETAGLFLQCATKAAAEEGVAELTMSKRVHEFIYEKFANRSLFIQRDGSAQGVFTIGANGCAMC